MLRCACMHALYMRSVSHRLDLWNIPIDAITLQSVLDACDANGDGGIDYKEFVDAFARDTVAPAAMGKRDMQSKEAMGVHVFDELDMMVGRPPMGHSKDTGEDMRRSPSVNNLYKERL